MTEYVMPPESVRTLITALPAYDVAVCLKNHTGYELRHIDRHDVAVLCEHFGLRPPADYR